VLEGPVARVLVTLAWPLAVSGTLLEGFRLVALYWMGHYAGSVGLSVMAIMGPIDLTVGWIFVALSAGAGSLVARSIGAKRGDGLTIVISATKLVLGVSIVLAAIGVLISGPLCRVLGVEPDVVDVLHRYFVWFCLWLPARGLMQLWLSVAIASGHTRMIIARVLIELAFIGGFTPIAMTTLGLAAAGPAVSQGIGNLGTALALGGTLYARRRELGLVAHTPPTDIPRVLWWKIAKIGSPIQAARVTHFLTLGVLVHVIARSGKAEAAGFGIALQVVLLAANLTLGIARGNAVVIGHSLGAQLPARVKETMRLASWIAFGVAATITIALFWPAPFVRLFAHDPKVVDAATRAIAIVHWSVLAIAAAQLLGEAYTATGVTLLAGGAFLIADAPALVLAHTLPGAALTAAAVAYLVSQLVRAALLATLMPHSLWRRLRATAATRA